jgi:hypothetical protein
MKGNDLGSAVIGGMMLAGLLYWLWLGVMAIIVPICVLSITTSLRGIRRELAQLNATRPSAPAAPERERAAAVAPAPPRPMAETVGAPGRLIAP